MIEPSPEVMERAARIELVLLDVDGVLSDGRLYMDASGGEMKAFHARDGMGIRLGQRGGLLFGIVSGRKSKVVRDRAEELYITEVHERVADKGAKLDEILARVGVEPSRVCFVGDDLVEVQVEWTIATSGSVSRRYPSSRCAGSGWRSHRPTPPRRFASWRAT